MRFDSLYWHPPRLDHGIDHGEPGLSFAFDWIKMSENEETVTISKVYYESLLDDERWRMAMESWGIDNWAGYDEAISEYYGEETD